MAFDDDSRLARKAQRGDRQAFEVIGRGTHERFAVDFAKFNARVAKKAAGA